MAVAMGITNVITLPGAVGVILGANIGSCITGFIASLPLSRSARQTSMAQILINVFGVLVFLPFIDEYANLITFTSPHLPRQIANAHTIFNVAVSVMLFPFVNQIADLSAKLIPASKVPDKVKVTAYIDEMQHSVPAVALTEAARELARLGEITAAMLKDSCEALVSMDCSKSGDVILQEDKVVDPICKELGDFINKLMRSDLSLAQQRRCFQLKNLLIDIERVGDMAEDISQFAVERVNNRVPFSSMATEELECLWNHAHHTYLLAVEAFKESDLAKARQVCSLESEFDLMYWQSRQSHIHRLATGVCDPEADIIFTETVRNLERISDHADNLGVSITRNIN